MNRQFLMVGSLLFACLLSSAGMSAPLDARQGHVLTLAVKVDGKQVMTPMVELLADAPAIVSLQGEQPNERYSLHLLLRDQQKVGKIEDAVAIEAQLFRGSNESEKLLADMSLFIRPGQGASATITGEHSEVQIAVLTHAIKPQ